MIQNIIEETGFLPPPPVGFFVVALVGSFMCNKIYISEMDIKLIHELKDHA